MVPVECAHVVAAEVGADRGVITLFFSSLFWPALAEREETGKSF